MNKKLPKKVVTGVLSLTFLGSLGYTTWYTFDKPVDPLENVKATASLETYPSDFDASKTGLKPFEVRPAGVGGGDSSEPVETVQEPQMLDIYQQAYELNKDLYAYLTIDSLSINLPVMYTPDDYDYYLRKNYYGEYSVHGTLFCDLENDLDDLHVIIYGHNMKDNSMFGDLDKFYNQEFFDNNPTFTLSNLYHDYTYEVIAVIKDKVHTKDETCFKYYNYVGNDTAEYNRFLSWVSLAPYSRNLEQLTEETQILMLSTCSYHTDNGRLVIVARRLTEEGIQD